MSLEHSLLKSAALYSSNHLIRQNSLKLRKVEWVHNKINEAQDKYRLMLLVPMRQPSTYSWDLYTSNRVRRKKERDFPDVYIDEEFENETIVVFWNVEFAPLVDPRFNNLFWGGGHFLFLKFEYISSERPSLKKLRDLVYEVEVPHPQ